MSVTTLNQLDAEQIDLLKNTICKGATDNELKLFLHACNRCQLDPFMRQIHYVSMGGRMTVQTGIDGYRLIAERTNKYMPGRETTYIYGKDGTILSATSYVKKIGPDGHWHEISATAIFKEYMGVGPLWKSKPHIMIAKCAEALALRKAFPADLSGVYTKEELEHGDNLDVEPIAPSVKNYEPPKDIEPLISSEEALELENMLSDEDPAYREDLLKYFTNVCKMSSPMVNLQNLPKKYLAACTRSIEKRRAQKNKEQKDGYDD